MITATVQANNAIKWIDSLKGENEDSVRELDVLDNMMRNTNPNLIPIAVLVLDVESLR